MTEPKPKTDQPLAEIPKPVTATLGIPQKAAISLDSLKDKIKEETKKPVSFSKDRAASVEEMNKLKELIAEKITTPAEATPPPKPACRTGREGRKLPQKILRQAQDLRP